MYRIVVNGTAMTTDDLRVEVPDYWVVTNADGWWFQLQGEDLECSPRIYADSDVIWFASEAEARAFMTDDGDFPLELDTFFLHVTDRPLVLLNDTEESRNA